MYSQLKRLMIILSGVFILLLIPLIAMQFTAAVNWTPFDFLVMGGLLLVAGLGCELVLRKVKLNRQRLLLCGAVVLAFLIIWAQLAVGIFN